MSNPFEDGPECDFCDIMLDEDESLEPLYVGEQPRPKPHRLHRVRDRSSTSGYGDAMHIMGRPAELYLALWEALQNCPDVDVELHERVEEVGSHKTEIGDVSSMTQYESRIRDDKVAAAVQIRPQDVKDNPDAMVCEDCASMFGSLGDG